MFSIHPVTGELTLVGKPVPSGGQGPVALASDDNGHVVVANEGSDTLGVFSIHPVSGALTLVSARRTCRGPADVAVSGKRVVAGCGDGSVQLYHFRHGELQPLDTRPTGSRVTSVVIGPGGHLAAAGTYPDGNVHVWRIRQGELYEVGVWQTGSDITDMALSGRRLFTTGVTARLAAFAFSKDEVKFEGDVPLTGQSSRTLAAVGRGNNVSVVVNEYNNNQTRIFRVAPTQ